ncbi:MAG TPA: GFA family protein [Alphaproteobacteria bacterium]|nr:GFA family protein [Alphaproteobacteria bacterium]
MKIDGSCHCGSITYQADVDPNEVYVCHCTDCQSISGSAFRWAVPVPEGAFKLLTGEPKTYVKRAASGAISEQLFCPECASPLYSTSRGTEPRVLNLRLGTAKQRAELPPKAQYWCRSAQDWVTVEKSSKRYDTQ